METFYIRKGANGTLPCLSVLPADSQAIMNKIEWFKEEKKLLEAEAKHIVVWNTKNTIAYLPETGALLFRGVGNEDSGEYHCLLTRSNGETEDGVVRFYVQGKLSFFPLLSSSLSANFFLRSARRANLFSLFSLPQARLAHQAQAIVFVYVCVCAPLNALKPRSDAPINRSPDAPVTHFNFHFHWKRQ